MALTPLTQLRRLALAGCRTLTLSALASLPGLTQLQVRIWYQQSHGGPCCYCGAGSIVPAATLFDTYISAFGVLCPPLLSSMTCCPVWRACVWAQELDVRGLLVTMPRSTAHLKPFAALTALHVTGEGWVQLGAMVEGGPVRGGMFTYVGLH